MVRLAVSGAASTEESLKRSLKGPEPKFKVAQHQLAPEQKPLVLFPPESSVDRRVNEGGI